MTNIYTDKYGRYHDKQTDGIEPSSNNGWIYTAYANKLGLPIDFNLLKFCFDKCYICSYPMHIQRTPDKEYPPISKDEIIGLISLGLLNGKDLLRNYYQYYNCGKPKPWYLINPFKTIKALWSLKDKHRNAVWQEKVYDAYPVAFRLGAGEVYYINKMSNIKTSLYQSMIFWIGSLFTIFFGKSTSYKNILWLQMKDLKLDSFLAEKLDNDMIDNFIKYFGLEHVFIKTINKNKDD